MKEPEFVSFMTEKCVICGGMAETWTGHQHADITFGDFILYDRVVTCGWCDEHRGSPDLKEYPGECIHHGVGCSGEWKPESGLKLDWVPPEDL